MTKDAWCERYRRRRLWSCDWCKYFIINQGKDNVAVCFFGDGAANEGTFHEGLNFASILNLPVIFVCENNQFAEGTTHDYASASETIAERAAAYNMPGVRVDGMDVLEVYKATQSSRPR